MKEMVDVEAVRKSRGRVAAAQKSCRDCIKRTIVLLSTRSIVLFLFFLVLLYRSNWIRSSESCYMSQTKLWIHAGGC